MKIQCEVDRSFSAEAREFAIRRSSFRLSRFSDQILDVRVFLKDQNGPKGGVDIRCLVWVRLERGSDVIIQEHAETYEQAVGNALDRANRNVARELRRKTHRIRNASRPLLPADTDFLEDAPVRIDADLDFDETQPFSDAERADEAASETGLVADRQVNSANEDGNGRAPTPIKSNVG